MFILVSIYAIRALRWFQVLTGDQTKLADLVQIAPEDFSKRSIDAIEDNLNAKYSNKVSI